MDQADPMIRDARPHAPLPITVSRRLPLAWGAIAWERFWPAAWPALGVFGLFLALGLFDLLPELPGWLHAMVLGGLLAGFGYGVWHFHRRFVWPTRAAALRRMERESGFTHQPLSLLDSAFAGSLADDVGIALWQEHRRRVASGLGPIRIGWPHRPIEDKDPRKLRIALLLLLMIGVLQSGNDTERRLASALMPRFGGLTAAIPPTTDLWITPPAYTGMAPIYIGGEALQHGVSVPKGSALLAQIHAPGADGDLPQLSLPGAGAAFTALDGQDFKAGAVFDQSGPLAITLDGRSLAKIDLAIIADKPPTAAFARPVSVTQRQTVRIDYKADDDYGVAGLRLELWRVAPSGAALPGLPLSIDIAVPAPPAADVADTLFQDLTASPWAGLPVEMRLVAKDGIGQEGASAAVKLVLPERIFKNEVARLLATWRKQLTVGPENVPQVVRGLVELSARPDLFRGDIAVFMGLRVTARELVYDHGPAAIADAQALMWSMALKLEGGAAAQAEKELRAAQKALHDALSRGASAQETDKLMRQLDTALDHYLQAMLRGQAGQQNQSQPQTGPQGNSRSISADQLKAMLRQAEEMARNGDKQGAEAMLRQLQSVLESLRMGNPSPSNSAARQAMEKMGSIMRQQQSLMDRGQQLQNGTRSPSFDGQGTGSSGKSPSGGQTQDNAGSLSEAQQGLRQQLDTLRQSMGSMMGQGDGNQAMDQAGQAMDRATRALRQGQADSALGDQADVLSAMRQAAQAMAQAMQQQGDQGASQSDPFGREGTGSASSDQGDVDLSNPGALQESRRILDELRRRAGEPDRPEIERDYIDRLLKDF